MLVRSLYESYLFGALPGVNARLAALVFSCTLAVRVDLVV